LSVVLQVTCSTRQSYACKTKVLYETNAGFTQIQRENFNLGAVTAEMAKKRPESRKETFGYLLPGFGRVVSLGLFVFLWSCEGRLFDPGSKEIAHGYRLKRAGDPSEFALLAPYDTGGIIIDEIGWRQPFIIARAGGSQYWDRIDTDHAEHIRISDTERRSNPKYRNIPIENADIAWNHLSPRKRVW
jgi:hypothetical protein